MHPALSVIIFTTASGAGYGLLALSGLFAAVDWLPRDGSAGGWAIGSALVLVTGGLLASTAHLGRPERAWRALSQWRTSWLSREGLLALASYVPALVFLAGWLLPEAVPWGPWGLLAAVAALLTVYATGKIYATLTPIPAWNNGLVVPGYLVLGGLGGMQILSLIMAATDHYHERFGWIVLLFATCAALVKHGYWRDIARTRSETGSATATGLGAGGERVRLLDAPHTTDNFVMREMGYRIARRHATRLRQICTSTLFAVPAMLALVSTLIDNWFGLVVTTALATASVAIGTLIERWLFFAEARHVVTAYYGSETV
ncbi:MAG: dimethyl sulfoxide reductase anchor subunit [Alphaproteobacteria bacterium]|nr:dimethyl sulfoxide reductase anchor subunit [Alphaproteobacteria bacterium]